MKIHETPSNTLNKLNGLFSYYENSTCSPKSQPIGLLLHNFNKFPIPKYFFNHDGEAIQQVTIPTKRIIKSKQEKQLDYLLQVPTIDDIRRTSIVSTPKMSHIARKSKYIQVPSIGRFLQQSQEVKQTLSTPKFNKQAQKPSFTIIPKRKSGKGDHQCKHATDEWLKSLGHKMDDDQLRLNTIKQYQNEMQKWNNHHRKTYSNSLFNSDLSKGTQRAVFTFQAQLEELIKT